MKSSLVKLGVFFMILLSATFVFAQNEQLYDFKLGVHRIGEKKNVVKFTFPGENVDLYLFSMSPWEGLISKKVQMVVSLYDKDKKIILSKKSVGDSGSFSAFGSIALGVSKTEVDDVKYFSIGFKEKEYPEKDTSIHEEGYTPFQEPLEEIYQNYAKAIDEKNIETAKKYMTKENIEHMEKITEKPEGIDMYFNFASMMMPRDLKNIQKGVNGNTAILSANSINDNSMFGSNGKTKIRILFKNEDGKWKIDKQENKSVFGDDSLKAQ